MKNDKPNNKRDELLDSNYDGIQEYDNDLPRWWRILFYLTILFGIIYTGYFLSFAPGDDERLKKEIADLKSAQPTILPEVGLSEESLRAMMSDQTRLTSGRSLYQAKCSPCHGAEGQGIVGPNLTDDSWIHGGKISDIRKTIEVGVPEKGMLSWKPLLSSDEITNLALFVRSLRGSNPPNPKAPQGEQVHE